MEEGEFEFHVLSLLSKIKDAVMGGGAARATATGAPRDPLVQCDRAEAVDSQSQRLDNPEELARLIDSLEWATGGNTKANIACWENDDKQVPSTVLRAGPQGET